MFDSKVSRKKKLCLDSNVLNEAKGGDFNYSFKIEKHYFNIIQQGDNFEMRIDNRTFSNLANEEKYKPKEVIKKVAEKKMILPKKIKYYKPSNT